MYTNPKDTEFSIDDLSFGCCTSLSETSNPSSLESNRLDIFPPIFKMSDFFMI